MLGNINKIYTGVALVSLTEKLILSFDINGHLCAK